MARNYTIPTAITGRNTYCNGCGHSIVIKTICQLIDEMGLNEKTEIVHGVGCCTNLGIDNITHLSCMHFSHGKTMAAATGVARCVGDGILVIGYHGDGDAYNIGFSETFNAAYRNENVVDIVINNSLYGMTGGQMSHTTLIGEPTENDPDGRDPEITGYPLRYPEMVKAALPHAFLARGGVFNPQEIRKTKELLRKAFTRQLNREGYSLVEILSMCPTNAHMTPLEVREWVEKEMASYYPLGIIQEGAPRGFIENF
ncbi:MAG: hypothetical protein IKE21_01140 [Erysipelotrichaceae bacterium]|nr:hypothetical protein [Erysipelotrichaceae bacterium]